MPISPSLITNAELILNGTVASAGSSSRAVASVYHYKRTNTVNALSKSALQTAFLSACRSAITSALSVRYTGTNLSCRWLDDATDAPALVAETHPGGVAGDSMPLTNSAFLLFQTGLRGRSFRGSKHYFPIAESATTIATDDIFNAGMLTLLAAIGTALIANLTDANGNVWQPCVMSRTLSQLRRNPTTVIANPITAILVAKRVGIMRHRRVKPVY